jgi:hypothetical protein
MKAQKFIKQTLLATAIATVGLTGGAGSASAYVVCNRAGDCWHTDTRVHFPGVRLTFHPDAWWDHHKTDSHFNWHEVDGGHDWHHGYWDHGTWHPV